MPLLLLLALAADAKPAANFTLTDPAGKAWALADQKSKATVVVFLAAECPMSNGYLPTLIAAHEKYAAKGVTVVGVFPDPDTTAAQVAAHAKQYKVPFPLLRDPAHAAVNSLGAKTTPEVVVLDEARAVRYRGRIDDGYVSRMKPKATIGRHDLTAALDELLAGKPVSLPEAKAFGCPIAPLDTKAAANKAITFHKDVVPILQAHCQSCHRPDQVAPFALTSYKQAAKWADLCLEEIESKRMPPWKPAPNTLLAGERSLPAAAKKTLEAWVAQGKPEGDPKDAPPPATFAEGWTLGEPDLILEAPSETTIAATGRDLFRVQVFPTNLPEDKYIVAMEVKPGNPRVVHHTLQLIDVSGRGRKLQADAKPNPNDPDFGPGYRVSMGWGFLPDRSGLLGGWAPGMLPKKLPDGVGQRLPKGADLCVQTHYHRTGKLETDRTRIGLYFSKVPVTEKFVSVPATGVFGIIPAGRGDFKVDSSWQVTDDTTLYRLVPHMHLIGKDIELLATLPGQEEKSLIRIPVWDYNWQEQYELKEPMKLPKGTVVRVRATYDNSSANPHNPSSPPAMVRLGEQTTNEMCFVFLGVSSGGKSARLLAPAAKR